MKNTLLISLAAAGLVLAGCNKSTRTSTASTDPALAPATPAPAASDTVGAKIDRAGDRVASASREAADKIADASRDATNAVREAGHDLHARYTEWRLSDSDLRADIDANRDIVRTRTSIGAPTGKVDKGTIEKAIKGRLHADFPDLKFDANANSKGEVELEGKARTTDQIAHAMAVALDTDGVTQVTSKIKLDPDAGPNRK